MIPFLLSSAGGFQEKVRVLGPSGMISKLRGGPWGAEEIKTNELYGSVMHKIGTFHAVSICMVKDCILKVYTHAELV